MKDVKSAVEGWLLEASELALGAGIVQDPHVRPAKDAKFGDYQANLAMPLAKALRRKPRDIALAVVEQLKADDAAASALESVEVAGPGFINLKLSQEFVSAALARMGADPRLGVEARAVSQTVVVDYSGPNLAKEMHIGHVRSTIIGDCLCRVLEFRGDQVIRQNHVGDWGTQFGMLLEHLLSSGWDPEGDSTIRDLDQLYQDAKRRFDEDESFANAARKRVVSLQAGDVEALRLWKKLIGESTRHMNAIYERLGVLLGDADMRPESFYNPRLSVVVEDLKEAGLATTDAGAQVTFPEGFRNKEGDPLPLIVQKRDGGYGYATTDLAAGRYRARELGADRVIYVVDFRQSDHFAMVFWTLRASGWAPQEAVRLEHVAFGAVLGKDRKPFKTRQGGTIKLVDVLAEAESRALAAVSDKNPNLDRETAQTISSAVGIGAVKYADLSSERIKDYVFDYDRMLALEGNTAPYLMYAYARIQSIFRNGSVDAGDAIKAKIEPREPQERELSLLLLQFPRVVDGVAESLEPHRLCGYLYEVASGFHSFHYSCRVLNPGSEQLQSSRLALCALTAKTLSRGLGLLGIGTVEKM